MQDVKTDDADRSLNPTQIENMHTWLKTSSELYDLQLLQADPDQELLYSRLGDTVTDSIRKWAHTCQVGQ